MPAHPDPENPTGTGSVGAARTPPSPRGGALLGVVLLLLAIGGVALIVAAFRLMSTHDTRDLIRRCDSVVARLGRLRSSSTRKMTDVNSMTQNASQLAKALREADSIRKEADEASLSDVDRQRVDGMSMAAEKACTAVAEAVVALARSGEVEADPDSDRAGDPEKLQRSFRRLETSLRKAAQAASADPAAAEALAGAADAAKSCADEFARVEETTFQELLARLASGDSPRCISELEVWRANRQRFFFTTKTYETNQLTYSTTTHVTGRVGYSVVLGESPDAYAEKWRGLRGDLQAVRTDLAAAKAEGELSDEEVDGFSERMSGLAKRIEEGLDAPPEKYLILRTADVSDFDESKASTIAEEGSPPRAPWDISPSVFDSAFPSIGCTLPQVNAAIEKIRKMSHEPVDLEETLPELQKPLGMPLFGEPSPAQQRIMDSYNIYVVLYNAELRRRNRVGLDKWLEGLDAWLAEAAPEKSFTRLTVRCRAAEMPELVKEGLAKTFGAEPAPFVLVEAEKPEE